MTSKYYDDNDIPICEWQVPGRRIQLCRECAGRHFCATEDLHATDYRPLMLCSRDAQLDRPTHIRFNAVYEVSLRMLRRWAADKRLHPKCLNDATALCQPEMIDLCSVVCTEEMAGYHHRVAFRSWNGFSELERRRTTPRSLGRQSGISFRPGCELKDATFRSWSFDDTSTSTDVPGWLPVQYICKGRIMDVCCHEGRAV